MARWIGLDRYIAWKHNEKICIMENFRGGTQNTVISFLGRCYGVHNYCYAEAISMNFGYVIELG